VAFDAFALERPVKPKPVETGLVHNDDPKALTRPQLGLLLKLCEALHQPGRNRRREQNALTSFHHVLGTMR
jgi:hypothetical protein